MRKKVWIAGLTLAMSLSMAACGGSKKESTSADISEEADVQEDGSTEDADAEDEETDIEEGDAIADVDIPVFDTSGNIEETVLYDENDVVITALGIEYTEYAVELNLEIQNNSDKQLTFISESLGYSCNSVNGYMISDGYVNTDVAAGKTANESAEFAIDGLQLYGINSIADIQIGFDIIDADYNDIYTGVLRVETDKAEEYDYAKDTYIDAINNGIMAALYDYKMQYFSQDEMYNQSGMRVISAGSVQNSDEEQLFLLEVINETDHSMSGMISDICVNGICVGDNTWSTGAVNAGCKGITSLNIRDFISAEEMEKLGITDIGKIEFTFETCDVTNGENEYNDDSCAVCVAVPDFGSEFDKKGEELYNENGIRIVSKGLIEDSYESSTDIHWIMLVENTSGGSITFDDVDASLSVNGIMTDYSLYGRDIASETWLLVDTTLKGDSLTENGISGIDAITEIEVSLELRDENYDVIAEPIIKISLN